MNDATRLAVPQNRQSTKPQKRQKREQSDWKQAILFCAPAVLLLFVFRVYSFVYSAYVSLFDWGIQKESFVGLGNYVEMFTTDLYRISANFGFQLGDLGQSFLVTLSYAVISVPVSIFLSFLFAYFLFYAMKARTQTAYRMAFFLPYITSSVAAIFVFRWMSNTQYGLFNMMLESVGLPRLEWVNDPLPVIQKLIEAAGAVLPHNFPAPVLGPTLALCVIIIYSVWSSVGFNVVIYLSGMSAIPAELYEAAEIDGAGKLRSIWHVTLPLISPTTFFLSITSVIGAFEAFNAFYLFTSGYQVDPGGPGGSTNSMALYIFSTFYKYNRAGYACALSILLFLLILVLTIVQKRVGDKHVFYNN